MLTWFLCLKFAIHIAVRQNGCQCCDWTCHRAHWTRIIKCLELGVAKPLKESAEELANITSQHLRKEYERNVAIDNEITEMRNMEKVIEHQGGSVLSPSEEFFWNTYGEDLEPFDNYDDNF